MDEVVPGLVSDLADARLETELRRASLSADGLGSLTGIETTAEVVESTREERAGAGATVSASGGLEVGVCEVTDGSTLDVRELREWDDAGRDGSGS